MDNENTEKMSLEELAELLKKAKNIKEEKTGKKITHQMIADAIGVDRVSVTLWEQGKRHPGFLNILNYCQFLGITVNELMGLKTNRTLQIELTEEERDAVLSMLDECKDESEINNLQSKLRFLEQYIKGFFGRAHTKIEK